MTEPERQILPPVASIGIFGNILILTILSIYIAIDRDDIAAFLYRLVPPAFVPQARVLSVSVSKSFVETHRESLPVVPLRDMVVFPHMMAPFIVGRESSVHALEIALGTPEKRIFLVAQRDPKIDEPMREDLYDFGVVARVVQNLKLPNGNIKVMVEGLKRNLAVQQSVAW